MKKKKEISGEDTAPLSADMSIAMESDREQGGFPVVGIGASAGGLAAFEAFFSGMPKDADPGMAFVLVQHLAPDHKSILTDLIRRYTRMQVFEVEDGMTVQPNCAYIIPPGRDMAFLNGSLQLLEPAAPRGQRLPIDFFFRSLAMDQRERAVCIVLSGTGSDGTLGVRAIKGEGGMAMAQTPASTEYDGMPRSAIATGLVDFELPPAQMPDQLIAYMSHAFGKLPLPPAVHAPKTENALKKIFILLRAQTGHDFSQYKPSTINRRIERRMAVQQIDALDGYVKYLQQTPTEVEALFRDLLIGVTNFFRDPEAFHALEAEIIPKLFAGKGTGSVIRVWSPGCCTGEEAYSIAILLQERTEALKQSFTIQVFATDIDSQAIATARVGLYPASITADITPERLSRFFTAEPAGADGSPGAYRIHKGIRDMLVFSEQDVIKDPPFSKLDLISCRNLLIYMGAELQKRLIPLFHYALLPGGSLFLGTSETVGEFGDRFTVLDRKQKLYMRKEDFQDAQRAALGRILPVMSAMDAALPRSHGKTAFPVKLPLRELTEQALLHQIAPAGALVNGQGDILYLHGRTGMYLEPSPGEAGINNILKMAREGLRRELAVALHKAVFGNEIVRCPGLRVKTNAHFSVVDLCIRPVATGPAGTHEAPLYLVILEEAQPPESQQTKQAVRSISGEVAEGPAAEGHASNSPADDEDARIAALRQELRSKEEYLQTANEELETSNEELKSSNEEMQSVNEELQSTNEELETSKEELQSVNEELATVNAELQTKVADLSRANNDMNNLLAGTGIATVFVDHQLRILRFTPSSTGLINLIPSDVGRPVGHIVSNLVGYGHIAADARGVLDTLITKETDVQTPDGMWYKMRILPYRTLDNVIEGAVITFIDITEMKRAQESTRESESRLREVLENSQDVAYKRNLQTNAYEYQSPVISRISGYTPAEMKAMPLEKYLELVSAEDLAEIERVIAEALAGAADTAHQVEYRFKHKDGQYRWFKDQFTVMRDSGGKNLALIGSISDITGRKQAEESLRKANELLRLAVVVRDSRDAITVQDLDGRTIAWNPGAARIYGWSESEALEMNVRDRIPEELRKEALAKVLKLSQAEILNPYRTWRLTKNGRVVEVSIISTALVDETGAMYAIATTERLRNKITSPQKRLKGDTANP